MKNATGPRSGPPGGALTGIAMAAALSARALRALPLLLLLSWLPAQAQPAAQSAAASARTTAPAAPAATQAAKPVSRAPSAAKAKARAQPDAKVANAKGPVAAKNVAVGAAAVPAAPKALLSHGCLDSAHGEWLRGELGDGAHALPEVAAVSFEAAPVVTAQNCVPFAAVRTPASRIESVAAIVPAVPAVAGEGGELRRTLVVSRVDFGSAAATNWLDVPELPPGQRELWLPAAAVLEGEAGDRIPARWLRDVSLLARQMKRHAGAEASAWVRLVLADEGDSVRLLAMEWVDETGLAQDSALWLDRSDGPGGFVSARGGDLERLLWQSPVDYRRISRGVGAASVIVRKRVFAQPKTPGGKPRVVIRSFRTRGQHLGIDFAAPTGTPVVTVAEGTVVHAGKSGGYGNLVVVDHGGGVTTHYAHLSAYGAGVEEGARVERGQEIGLVGSTGMSTGPHLHFEIRKDGRYLDPADPAQTLPNWNLGAGEHQAALTRLLALSITRAQGFAKAARPALAAAAQPVVAVRAAATPALAAQALAAQSLAAQAAALAAARPAGE